MTPRRNNVEGLIEALQSDLPTGADEARIRAQLVGAGVLASGVLTGASAAAATLSTVSQGAVSQGAAMLSTATPGAALVSGGASAGTVASVAGQLGLWSQLVALPVVAKVGATTALLAAVATVSVSQMSAPRTSVSGARTSATSASPMTRTSAVPVTVSPGGGAVAAAAQVSERASDVLSLTPRPSESAIAPAVEKPLKGLSAAARTASAERGVTPAPAAGAPKSALRATTLAQETPLIERAMLAIQAGDSARARYWLDEHARLFPQGLLARERSIAASRIPAAHPGASSE